jgi:hypothetical protein
LNVTVQSYAGSLEFGIVAARDTLRDTAGFARAMREAFAELQVLRGHAGSAT